MDIQTTSYKFLVTGGGGYIGFHVGLALVQLKQEVVLFDIKYPSKIWDPSIEISSVSSEDGEVVEEQIRCSYGTMKFVKGDIRNIHQLLKATENVICVIHSASYGMSGREQLPRYFDMVENVNVHGTRNVIEACARNGCKGLVYTSTVNVVFGGKPILNGDESLPYFPLHRYSEHYSRTKSIAEQLVLTSNGRGTLQTCALRLAGVMGRGEMQILPRFRKALDMGMIFFNFYDEYGGKVDWIGIDNVVQGHVKAAFKLCDPEPNVPKIGGQAYFLTDGRPVNTLEYFRPVIEYHGQEYPTAHVPLWVMHLAVLLIVFVHSLVSKFIDFVPYLNRAELDKSSVTHYFSIEKARRELGYHPVKPNDLSDAISSFSETRL